MAARTVVLVVALVFILGFAYLTLHELATNGLDAVTVLAFVVLALFGFGILGALLRPPEE